MKKLIAAAAVALVLAAGYHAQTQDTRRVIEVSGSAERLVTPNEFTFKITLNERMENKQKITIEQQEKQLTADLAIIGVDTAKDLSIYDISSTYFRQKKVKDVLGTKDYRLKIRDLNKISRLQELADRLNVAKLDLTDSEHSDITRLRRETKTDAIKAAKEKADYLLAAIGERAGRAVYVKEEVEETPRYVSAGVLSNMTSNTMSYSRSPSSGDTDEPLSFSDITIRYVIVAKFEIE